MVEVINKDCLSALRGMPDESVNCCVTSPPYYRLRDYGVAGQIGLENTPDEYVEKLVKVFREVRRVIKPDGTLWLNLGDSYAGSSVTYKKIQSSNSTKVNRAWESRNTDISPSLNGFPNLGIKPKDIIGIPWRVAFALQRDGWYLRQDIIWHKPNPVPESVTDRCTKAHEYIFLLSKSQRYYFDRMAIATPAKDQADDERRMRQQRNGLKSVCNQLRAGFRPRNGDVKAPCMANRRSVWSVATQPYRDAHFAAFPAELARLCILAGCPAGGTVLDPFAGSGTTGQVAISLGRKAVLIELNPDYIKLIHKRTAITPSLL